MVELRGPADAALVAEVFDRVSRTEQALGETADTFGLIHADLHQGNYVFKDGEVRDLTRQPGPGCATGTT
jgi:Ser/Thr protein kinase RdoA (MazF antagonist)